MVPYGRLSGSTSVHGPSVTGLSETVRVHYTDRSEVGPEGGEETPTVTSPGDRGMWVEAETLYDGRRSTSSNDPPNFLPTAVGIVIGSVSTLASLHTGHRPLTSEGLQLLPFSTTFLT